MTKQRTKAAKPVKRPAQRPTKANVPSDLANAVKKAADRIDGRYCYGLPHYERDVKVRVSLVGLGDLALFEESGVDSAVAREWIPFASLKGEPQFLAIQTTRPFAVGMWEHEDGTIYSVWKSLDELVARMLDKNDKTPFQVMANALPKVTKLIDAKRHADALALIEPLIQSYPETVHPSPLSEDDELAAGSNLYGTALQGLGRSKPARAAFQRAADAGNTVAELSVLALLEDDNRPRDVIEYALKVQDHGFADEDAGRWPVRFLACAYLDVGELAKAEAELKTFVEAYGSRAAKIAEMRAAIETYIGARRAGAEAAKGFLAWIQPKAYDTTPEQATDHRAWWDSLPRYHKAWQIKLGESIKLAPSKVPTDKQLAKMLEIEDLSFGSEYAIDDVTPAARLTRLGSFSCHGKVTTLQPLRALPRLVLIEINEEVIFSGSLPIERSGALFAAVENRNVAAARESLVGGASVFDVIKGKTALQVAAKNDDVNLARLLVEHGAPLEGVPTAFLKKHAELRTLHQQVVQAKRAASRFQIWEPADLPDTCILEYVRKFEHWLLFTGKPCANKFPKSATCAMRDDEPDDKRRTVVLDCLAYGDAMVVSKAVKDVLDKSCIDDVECLPVEIRDHRGKVASRDHFILNVLLQDCLDTVQSGPIGYGYSDEDGLTYNAVTRLVIDESRAADRRVFRVKAHDTPVIVRKDVAEVLGASGLTGMRFRDLVDFGKR